MGDVPREGGLGCAHHRCDDIIADDIIADDITANISDGDVDWACQGYEEVNLGLRENELRMITSAMGSRQTQRELE
ncbi:hypothetical protein N7468_004382 [Penicillium chermesinum]|uniref:Uncharacterized protein n=1 Tax=Penicillium chermesinum TaxID=63820 RepID=A0A9W9P8C2_9EURO|nr:uncharacterized protein N7468_004382 [Penicillium chermesinum]KAJ5239763.1 hypothetical protein N7468_004382 [Penicillium chermesinum]KAJ6166642.1 hypothetical protein N7470_002089 [Penicillium chermesinum]